MAKPRILPSISPLFIYRNRINNLFDIGKNYKITFVKASAGYGKTTAVLKWLSDKDFKNVFWLQIRTIDNYPDEFFNRFFGALVNKLGNPIELTSLIDNYKDNVQFNTYINEWVTKFALALEENSDYFYFVFDDIHLLSEFALNAIYRFIISSPENYRFIFTSRNNIPVEFSELVIKSMVYVIPSKTFNFTKEETKQYFDNANINLSDKQLNDILDFTGGRVSAYSAINVSIMQDGLDNEDIDVKKLLNNDYMNVFLKKNLWDTLDVDTKLVFEVASLFDEINIGLIQAIMGVNSKKIFDDFSNKMGYLFKNDENTYNFYPEFKELILKMSELSSIDKSKYYSLGAKYYLSLGNKNKALRILIHSNNYEQAADILAQISRSYDEFINNDVAKNMIFDIPFEIIMNRPELLKMAIINSLERFDIGKANYWFSKLISFSNNTKNSLDKRDSTTLITYLSVCIPQSDSITDFLNKIPSCIENIKNGNMKSFSSSFTGGFPSVISSVYRSYMGLDIRFIDKLINDNCIQTIFPKFGNALLQIAKSEIYYEKYRPHDSIILLTNILNSNDLPLELLFVLRIILFKSYLCLGKKDLALKELITCKNEINKKGSAKMLKNYRDFTIRYSILKNEKNIINEWINSSINENESFILTDLFQLKTKICAYLYLKEFYKAIDLSLMIIDKYKMFNKHVDIVETYILLASAYHYVSDFEKRNKSIKEALKIAIKYDLKSAFIFFSNYSNEAIYSFYKENKLLYEERQFLSFIIDEQRRFLSFHSKLITEDISYDDVKLTKTEITVLNLIEEGFSNQDICDSLNIKQPTVKTHISNILSKLGVKNRTQAVKVAKEKSII